MCPVCKGPTIFDFVVVGEDIVHIACLSKPVKVRRSSQVKLKVGAIQVRAMAEPKLRFKRAVGA